MRFVYWFAFYNLNSPTVRYRGKYTTDYLRENYGIDSWLIIPSHNIKTFLFFLKVYVSALFFPKRDSIIVIQSVYRKSLYPTALKLLVKLRKKITFYDLDDADYLRYPPENIFYFLKNCNVVTLGSTELVKNLAEYNKNCVLITCPTPDLNIMKERKNDVLTIGWIGDFQKTHKESLINSFFPALHELPFKIKLVLMGVVKQSEHDFLVDYFRKFEYIEVEIPQNIDWLNEEGIQRRICEFDIGIATLLDDEFSRSKSAFKLKQCLNNGVPVLSSNIAENNLFLEHGVNGFLCENAADFHQYILRFNNMNDEEYMTYSRNARNSTPLFDLKSYCDGLIKTYEEKVNRSFA